MKLKMKYFLGRHFSVLATLFFLLPFYLAIYLLINQTNKEIQFTYKEIVGVEVHNNLFDALSLVQEYRLIHDDINKSEDKKQYIQAVSNNVTQYINNISNLTEQLEEINLTSEWESLRPIIIENLETEKKKYNQPNNASPSHSTDLLVSFMKNVGNKSNLILDPEIETYYMINIIMNILPQAVNNLLSVQENYQNLATQNNIDAKHLIIEANTNLKKITDDLSYSISIIDHNDPENVSNQIEKGLQLVANLQELQKLMADMEKGGYRKDLYDDFLKKNNLSIKKFRESYHRYSEHLLWHLDDRIKKTRSYYLKMIASMFLCLIGAIATFLFAGKKLVEQQIVNDAKRTDAIMKTVVDGIVTINSMGTIKSFNPAAEKIFGYYAKDVLGKNVNILMPEPYHSEHDGYLKKYSDTGKKKIIGSGREVTAKRNSGELFPIDLAVSDFFMNEELCFVASIRDITERREQLKTLEEYAHKMELAREEAVKATRMKSDFLATMSHEIRTPMNGIIGMTELLLESDLKNHQKNYARTVMNSAESLLAIINDILDYSKIEAGKMELENLPFDLQKMLDETSELMAAKARDKTIELIVRIVPKTPTYLIGDIGRIRQVVTNLIDNAIKFTKKGRVLVTVEEIVCALDKYEHACIRISVEDTGIGIPKYAQENLFQKFSQADSSTTRKYGGTGLGLAICKELAEMMNGLVGLKSEEGKGSTFWLTMTLPRQLDADKYHQAPAIDYLKDIRVLVVDDLIDNTILIKEQLETMGMQCITTSDASEGYHILCEAKKNNEPIQIAIIDYFMPKMNGDVLVKTIKASDSPVKNTEIILLSNFAKVNSLEHCAPEDISAYLSKPIHNQQLINTVARICYDKNINYCRNHVLNHNERKYSDHTDDASEQNYLLKNAKILIVEDNIINQTFITEILNKFGVCITMANNGIEAIKETRLQNFDLILMDCQMPVMDGFEATIQLKEMMTKKEISHIPIIALTANAMSGDKEKCLECGMDDYLAKPFKKNQIIEKLLKWLDHDAAWYDANIKDSSSASEHSALVDVTLINEAKDLMDKNFTVIVNYYFEDADKYISLINDAINQRNQEAITLPAHTLKSTSHQLGAILVSEIAKKIEAMARTHTADNTFDVDGFSNYLRELSSALEKTKKVYKHYVN